MANKGFSHVGLSTLDLDKTRDFYERILGFKPVVADTIKIKEGGAIRHIFFDTGRDQLLAFMESRGVPGVPVEYDAGINRGLGVPAAFYHFAFEAGSEAGLEAKRQELAAKGVQVTDIVDHNWAKSIYFKDPNGISLEYCCLVREFVEDDAKMQDRFEISVKALGLDKMNVGEVTTAKSHSSNAKAS
jgi:catechol 2,3-dioxygenase-like lactoylglutathione lyase family enzyme